MRVLHPRSRCPGRRARSLKLRPYPLLTSMAAMLICLATSVASLGAQAASPDQADIVTALRNGDAQGALARAQAALRHTPRDCSLLSLEAIAFTGLHQQQPALSAFEKALTICPSYLPALIGAAQIQYAQAPPSAIPLLTRILLLQPENAAVHGMLATALRSQSMCAEALPHYQASTTLFPSRPDLQQGYGSCLASSGDPRSALAQYLSLLAARPNDSIRYDVAVLQWKSHANEEALSTLAPLLGEPAQSSPLSLASRIHEDQGETPQAVELLRRAILAAPSEPANYLDFATIAFNHKSFQVGIDMLNAGLKQLPNAASLYVARGVLEVQVSNSQLAVADFGKAHALDPKLSFAADAIGIMHSQQHESGDSLSLFTAEARQSPNDPLLQYLLAEELSNTSAGDPAANLNAAIAAAVRAVSVDPQYKAAHDLLAVLYIRAGKPELAIQQAELALTQDPNDEDALYQEMMACRASGQREKVQALTARFNEARRANEQRQQSTDRYRLQDEVAQ